MITRRFYFCVVLLAGIFSSCTKPDITFGADYLDNNYTNIAMIDTATATVSTVFMDSFVTSATGKAIAGKYSDPYFGTVTAESYFPLAPPTYADVYSNTLFDSIEVIIKPNKSFYGDTTQPLLIQVHQLAEQIVYAENKTSCYNVNTFAVSPTALGSKTIKVRPSVTDTIAIRIADAVGTDLLNKLQLRDEIIQTPAKFIDYFKGIRISTGNNNSFALGFSDSVIMRLHYSEKGIIPEKKTVDFTLSDNTLQFNHISINRSGTALSTLSSLNNEISSLETNNAGYLQTATASIVKIRFPNARDFLAIPNFLKIQRAELIIKPVSGSFNGFYPLPPQLRLSETTQLNELGNDITVTDASGAAQTQYGDLNIDDLYGENTGYVYDITTYLNTQLANAAINKNGLFVSAPQPSFQSDFNRLLIGNKNNPNGSIKLRVYYITVNQN